MNLSKKIVKISGLVSLLSVLLLSSASAQNRNTVTTNIKIPSLADRSTLLEVTFKVNARAGDQEAIESLQSRLQSIEGVRYVGVSYQSREVVVRYLSTKVSFEKLAWKFEKTERYPISEIAGPKIVEAKKENDHNILSPALANVVFEYLAHHEAQTLCEEHFQGELPKAIELEKCYIIKVDFRPVTQVSAEYDWHSRACLVDEAGQLIKPLSWLELPSLKDAQKDGSLSGLLIFPKIPLLRLGLTLRLLRANGEGYDSFTVDVPEY